MRLHRPFEAITPTLDGAVLLVLARADAGFTGGDLARMIEDASASGVRKAVQRLVDQGVVTRETVGQSHDHRLNRDHLLAPAIEAIARAEHHLRERIANHVDEWPRPPHAVIMFGSAARGEMLSESDIDLLVVGEFDDLEDASFELSVAVRSWTGNDTRIIHLPPDALLEMSGDADPLLQELLRDGRVLWGPPRYLHDLMREMES